MPHTSQSFPKAILHVDGDAFFSSCEMAMNPSLKGRPVITGKERGIVASMSYEARAKGITRAMKLHEVKKICPDAVILPSDYETYSLFSERMFAILRRYTPEVEEYGIDEAFADLTGLRRPLRMSYEAMAGAIKRELEGELGLSFSVGLGPNKVISKVASGWKKPSGFTVVSVEKIAEFLQEMPVGRIWGIGPSGAMHLNKEGVKTALQFADKPEGWVKDKFYKPHHEIWSELQGNFVYPLVTEEKHDYQSISKTKTFTPPSMDEEFVFSQLSKNIENACIKLRRHNLGTKNIYFFLKTQGFNYRGIEFQLANPVSTPREILKGVKECFRRVFKPKTLYRSTGVVFWNLQDHSHVQSDLFGQVEEMEKMNKIYESIDEVDKKFGKHSVYLGSSFKAINNYQHLSDRGDIAKRVTDLFKGENKRQRIGLPMLGDLI